MPAPHPNMAILEQLDITDIDSCAHLFAEDVTFHYFNPELPEIAGAYHGIAGVKTFFARIAEESAGTFRVAQRGAWPVGDELVVVQTCNTLTLADEVIEVDVVLVWRFVDGRIAEVWDIPAVHTARTSPAT
ncbi:MAG: nuclear transport factor 2 family protein [Rhodobacteraceae bacterium]|nr:nuclear transport factor 2 family protein [Paracoccaceae bacterium]